MPISKCVKELIEASKGKITTTEAEFFLKDADKLAKKIQQKEGLSADMAVEKAVAKRLKETKQYLEINKLNKLITIQKYNQKMEKVRNLKNQGLSINDSLKSILVGTQNYGNGVRDSIDNTQVTITSGYMSKFLNDLDKRKLHDAFYSGVFSKEIANDLWALSLKDKNKRVFSGSPEAKEIAEVVHDVFNNMKNRLNKNGANIEDIQGFIVSQTHDTDKMVSIGKNPKQEWIDFIKPKLDLDKSFDGNYEDIDDALGKAFEAIVTGIRKKSPEPQATKLFQFEKVGDLAKKLSQKRNLIFKSADDFMAYNDVYGQNTLNEAIVNTIETQSKNIGILQEAGVQPNLLLKKVVDDFMSENREELSITGKKVNIEYLHTAIDMLTSEPSRTANPSRTALVNNIKSYNMLRLMGGTVLSSISNVSTKSIGYQHNGRSILGAYSQYFKDTFNYGFKSTEDKRRYAVLTGVFTENYVGHLKGRIADSKTFSSKLSKTTNLFMKINGMQWLDSTDKISMGMTLSHDLALQKNRLFNELDDDAQRNFKLMNITPDDWDVMRKSTRTLEDDGRDYLFSEDIDDIEIGDKLRAYYIDNVRYAIPEQSTSTKARLAFGTKRGEAMGEILQLVMQFKGYSVAVAENLFGRALYQKGKPNISSVGMLSQIIISMTVMGYLAMTAKDMLKGLTPRDPYDPKTILAALVQGGGLGVIGDIFFAQQSSMSRGALAVVAGPTFGVVDDVIKVWQDAISGNDPSARTFQRATALIPGQNLIYIQPVVQAMRMSVQEHLNPGSVNRAINQRKKETGQTYWVNPKWDRK